MSDVTFGVKVSEEMKAELSQLMKEHALSGKEFMSLLLASYRLDQAKEETQCFESDLVELQNLMKRIGNIFLNMTEKSKSIYDEEKHALEKVIETQQAEKETYLKEIEDLKQSLETMEKAESKLKKQVEEKDAYIKSLQEEVKVQKTQVSNNLLLHEKFEEEVKGLQEKIESYKRLELEIEERNEENSKLKTRNDEIASEQWFLQREVEKLKQEKQQMQEKYQAEQAHLQSQFELRLKNELLEQKLQWSDTLVDLKDEIMRLNDEKRTLIQKYEVELKENAVKKQ